MTPVEQLLLTEKLVHIVLNDGRLPITEAHSSWVNTFKALSQEDMNLYFSSKHRNVCNYLATGIADITRQYRDLDAGLGDLHLRFKLAVVVTRLKLLSCDDIEYMTVLNKLIKTVEDRLV